MERTNCWEIMKCGRQPGGESVEELGVCPAALSNKYDGVNKGQHGGRFCWAIAGTLCGSSVQGTFAEKFADCLKCEVLKQISVDEGREFILSPKDAESKKKA